MDSLSNLSHVIDSETFLGWTDGQAREVRGLGVRG